MTPPPRRPPVTPAGPAGGAPIIAALAVVAAGLVLVEQHHFRLGSGVVALGLLLGAALRLVLPPRRAGLLAVRSRPVDVLVLGGLGLAVLALAVVVPRTNP